MGHVHYRPSLSGDKKLGADSLDEARLVMPYGKLFDLSPDKGKPVDEPGQYIEQIVTALKPGGDGEQKTTDPAAPANPRTGRDFDLFRKPDPDPGAGPAVPP